METIDRARLTFPWCTVDKDGVLQLSLLVCITKSIDPLLHKAMPVKKWSQ